MRGTHNPDYDAALQPPEPVSECRTCETQFTGRCGEHEHFECAECHVVGCDRCVGLKCDHCGARLCDQCAVSIISEDGITLSYCRKGYIDYLLHELELSRQELAQAREALAEDHRTFCGIADPRVYGDNLVGIRGIALGRAEDLEYVGYAA